MTDRGKAMPCVFRRVMKKLLIDTDIGIDCDDAMAIGAAIALEKKGLIHIEGISTCTAREGASGCVSAITDYYGLSKPTASYFGTPLECDKRNIYAKDVRDAFRKKDSGEESVRFLRKKLASSEDGVILVSLGPMTVIAALLESMPDDISLWSGRELVARKAEALYAMGGNFVAYEDRYKGRYAYGAEWNICQDIPAAQFVVENIPVPVIFSPYETGVRVLSGESFGEGSPVKMSIRLFFERNRDEFEEKFARASWDPITVCMAAGADWFSLSSPGRIAVDDEGKTLFFAGKGNHRYLIEKNQPEQTAEKLDELYAELEKNVQSSETRRKAEKNLFVSKMADAE